MSGKKHYTYSCPNCRQYFRKKECFYHIQQCVPGLTFTCLICNGVDKKEEWNNHILICRKYSPGSITAEQATRMRQEKDRMYGRSSALNSHNRQGNQSSTSSRGEGTGIGAYIQFIEDNNHSLVLVVGETTMTWLLSNGNTATKSTEGHSWVWAKDYYNREEGSSTEKTEEQKDRICEHIYDIICQTRPDVDAGKITGMLMEMDCLDLLYLLESQEALDEKVREALELLEAHKAPPTAARNTNDDDSLSEEESLWSSSTLSATAPEFQPKSGTDGETTGSIPTSMQRLSLSPDAPAFHPTKR